MKRGGLAAAQLKRHAGGTSVRVGILIPPTHVTECRVNNPSRTRRFVNLFFKIVTGISACTCRAAAPRS